MNYKGKNLKTFGELIDYVIGVELVIDDDGNIYIDYNKNIPMASKDIKLFNDNIYVIK